MEDINFFCLRSRTSQNQPRLWEMRRWFRAEHGQILYLRPTRYGASHCTPPPLSLIGQICIDKGVCVSMTSLVFDQQGVVCKVQVIDRGATKRGFQRQGDVNDKGVFTPPIQLVQLSPSFKIKVHFF